MYNRYIPQADGSYRRDTVRPKEPPKPAPPPPCPPEPESELPPPVSPPCRKDPRKTPKAKQTQGTDSVGNFLRQLLPGDLDTGDLLVIVLLLLMSGDCREDRNHALPTLVLYLFL